MFYVFIKTRKNFILFRNDTATFCFSLLFAYQFGLAKLLNGTYLCENWVSIGLFAKAVPGSTKCGSFGYIASLCIPLHLPPSLSHTHTKNIH